MPGRSWTSTLLMDGVLVWLWAASVMLVVLHERGTLWGGGQPMATLAATLDGKEAWFGIYYQGQRIGYSRTWFHPDEHKGVPGVRVIDQGRMVFNLMGAPQRLDVGTQAFIDSDWRLQQFVATFRTPNYAITWKGFRQGDNLVVSVETPGSAITKVLKDPNNAAFVNGLSSWATFHRLRVGQYGKAWVLNPLALKPEPVYYHVPRAETFDGQEVVVVETDVNGLTTTSWVTPAGEVLREISPLGWELRRETQQDAITSLTALTPTLDLLSTTSVPIDRLIEHPDQVERLVVLIEGVDAQQFTVQSPWQTILTPERLNDYQRTPPEGPWCALELRRPVIPDAPVKELPREVQAYLQPTLFIQSDDRRMIDKARRIVGAQTDPWEQAEALTRWVFATVHKRFTIGLPSAVDVLQTPSGDCHEHAVLFTALARSLGIPTRMIGGLVYQGDRLYYHAWPEVWFGTWIPTDPTLGQAIADATHVRLIEAENEELLSLSRFIGHLKLQVLDLQEAAALGR